jgi:DHA2 family multidrug resistance protein
MVLVAWGIPKMPLALLRLRQGNWLGMALGIPGLGLVVIGLVDQGVRLDWFHSPIIVAAIGVGSMLTVLVSGERMAPSFAFHAPATAQA